MTLDGRGEYETACVFEGRGGRLRRRYATTYPHSIGYLYSMITRYLGFRPQRDAPSSSSSNPPERRLPVHAGDRSRETRAPRPDPSRRARRRLGARSGLRVRGRDHHPAGTVRLLTNPEHTISEQIVDYAVRRGVFAGWTLPELAVLHRYRRRAA